jgi:hypothetical protein
VTGRVLEVWQDGEGWHVGSAHDRSGRVFATRDEAIAYSESALDGGRSPAQAHTRGGDVPVPRPEPPGKRKA